MEGTHRVDGIFAAGGPGIAGGRCVSSDLVNVTPTVMAMLGVNVPDDMHGQVMAEVFDPPIQTGTEAAVRSGTVASGEAAFSDGDRDMLTQRLRDLGYLE